MASGKPIIDKNLCKGCELCVGVCPQKILSMSEDSNDQGTAYASCVKPDECTACTFCALTCPECAIRIIRYERVTTET